MNYKFYFMLSFVFECIRIVLFIMNFEFIDIQLICLKIDKKNNFKKMVFQLIKNNCKLNNFDIYWKIDLKYEVLMD